MHYNLWERYKINCLFFYHLLFYFVLKFKLFWCKPSKVKLHEANSKFGVRRSASFADPEMNEFPVAISLSYDLRKPQGFPHYESQ